MWKLSVKYQFLGDKSVKNITQPIPVYEIKIDELGKDLDMVDASPAHLDSQNYLTRKRVTIVLALLAITVAIGGGFWLTNISLITTPSALSIEARRVDIPERPVIAVLAFENLGNNPDEEYFSDGITEDITTDLSQISGLFVISHNSSLSYKGTHTKIKQIGQELGARYILEGSIRKVGNRIRINAKLIDAGTEHHIWADRFDRELRDIFALQDDVTRKIVGALKIKLTNVEVERLQNASQANPEAYDVFLRGLKQFRLFTREANSSAAALFAQAIKLDPTFARAYANAAMTNAQTIAFGWSENRELILNRAVSFGEKALALDPNLPQTHFALSTVYIRLKQPDKAIAAARRAIELDPSFADGYIMLAQHLIFGGKPELGLEAVQTAKLLNPHHTGIYFWFEGLAHFNLKNYNEAARLFAITIERNPEFPAVRLTLAATHALTNQQTDAEWEVEEAMNLLPDFTIAKESARAPYQNVAHLNHYIDGLRKAGFPE